MDFLILEISENFFGNVEFLEKEQEKICKKSSFFSFILFCNPHKNLISLTPLIKMCGIYIKLIYSIV